MEQLLTRKPDRGSQAEQMQAVIAGLNKIRDDLIQTSLLLHDAEFEMESARGGLPRVMTFEELCELVLSRAKDAADPPSPFEPDE